MNSESFYVHIKKCFKNNPKSKIYGFTFPLPRFFHNECSGLRSNLQKHYEKSMAKLVYDFQFPNLKSSPKINALRLLKKLPT
jgi:hypothetical protein